MPVTQTIGDLTIIALEDAASAHFDRREDAIPEATQQDWAAADAMDPGALTADGRWWLRFRSFALRYADGPVTLVDAGIGPAGSPGAWDAVPGRLPDNLAAAGIAAGDITTIVLTHLHSDHIGWAMPAWTPFPRARLVLQRADAEAFAPVLGDTLLAAEDRLDIRDGDADLGGGVRLLATPGHTPGHQCVIVSAADEWLAITGDLFVHAVQFGNPELAYAHDMDAARARESRKYVLRGGGVATTSWFAPSHLGEPFYVRNEGKAGDVPGLSRQP
jgi:glyoxylase-like metal-dependent hydrolase (beta-lactamase superfamily II)